MAYPTYTVTLSRQIHEYKNYAQSVGEKKRKEKGCLAAEFFEKIGHIVNSCPRKNVLYKQCSTSDDTENNIIR